MLHCSWVWIVIVRISREAARFFPYLGENHIATSVPSASSDCVLISGWLPIFLNDPPVVDTILTQGGATVTETTTLFGSN